MRGLSTRDVEATLEEALGEQAALSKSTVSRVCSVLVDQFQLWQRRDLSDYELDYLFADATFFKYHPAAKGEPVLCTHGITTEGKRAFIGLSAGSSESYDSWRDHFQDLCDRGLRPPLLGITDGNEGLISAFEQVFPLSLRQRCAVHVARNVIEKVSKPDQEEAKRDYWAILNDIEAPPGEAAVAIAEVRAAASSRSGALATPRRPSACSST